jgi:Cu/Ag efflux pump CusA
MFLHCSPMKKFTNALFSLGLAAGLSGAAESAEATLVVVVEISTTEQRAELVESHLTIPIENALGNLVGVRAIKSSSTHGHSRVEVGFAAAATEQDLQRVKSRVQLLAIDGVSPNSVTYALAPRRL